MSKKINIKQTIHHHCKKKFKWISGSKSYLKNIDFELWRKKMKLFFIIFNITSHHIEALFSYFQEFFYEKNKNILSSNSSELPGRSSNPARGFANWASWVWNQVLATGENTVEGNLHPVTVPGTSQYHQALGVLGVNCLKSCCSYKGGPKN